jgi:hypothetical protein
MSTGETVDKTRRRMLRLLRSSEEVMAKEVMIKDFLDKAFSYEIGTILKLVELGGHKKVVPCVLFCTVNDGVLDDVLFIHHTIEKSFKIEKEIWLNEYKHIRHLFTMPWRNFTIEPYYRINNTLLPLNNDVCGLIEKKLGGSVTLERRYSELKFEKEEGYISNFTLEEIKLITRIKTKTEQIIIRINPYDYKNFEVKFINMPEFKIININDLKTTSNIPKLLNYAF